MSFQEKIKKTNFLFILFYCPIVYALVVFVLEAIDGLAKDVFPAYIWAVPLMVGIVGGFLALYFCRSHAFLHILASQVFIIILLFVSTSFGGSFAFGWQVPIGLGLSLVVLPGLVLGWGLHKGYNLLKHKSEAVAE